MEGSFDATFAGELDDELLLAANQIEKDLVHSRHASQNLGTVVTVSKIPYEIPSASSLIHNISPKSSTPVQKTSKTTLNDTPTGHRTRSVTKILPSTSNGVETPAKSLVRKVLHKGKTGKTRKGSGQIATQSSTSRTTESQRKLVINKNRDPQKHSKASHQRGGISGECSDVVHDRNKSSLIVSQATQLTPTQRPLSERAVICRRHGLDTSMVLSLSGQPSPLQKSTPQQILRTTNQGIAHCSQAKRKSAREKVEDTRDEPRVKSRASRLSHSSRVGSQVHQSKSSPLEPVLPTGGGGPVAAPSTLAECKKHEASSTATVSSHPTIPSTMDSVAREVSNCPNSGQLHDVPSLHSKHPYMVEAVTEQPGVARDKYVVEQVCGKKKVMQGELSSNPSGRKPTAETTNNKGTHNQSNSYQEEHQPISSNAIISGMPNATIAGANADGHLELSAWGLPEAVLERYHQLGITSMFPWQAECLCTGNALGGENLVYSAPTSAGKTLVAELLMLKRVLETRRKAILILPFISVAREKANYLQGLVQDIGVRVGGFMGGQSPPGGLANVDIAVCTIEKANSLINRLMEEGKMETLGMVVVDELHLVGDSHRGYLLELLLTKVCYVAAKMALKPQQNGMNDSHVQIVGMSATLPNLSLLAQWLKAQLYLTDFRPIPLTEMVKVGADIYDCQMQKLRSLSTDIKVAKDDDFVVPLCLETVRGGHGVLIFCPTKNWCETLADTVARHIYSVMSEAFAMQKENGDSTLPLPIDSNGLSDIVEQLKRIPVGLDKLLGRMLPCACAYHHAGLTFDERDIVEMGFRQGYIRVLVATSTLSSGVNLPARRVLVRSPVFHGSIIDALTYKQMIGRAGRKGIDTCGESILLCKDSERAKAVQLMQTDLPPVQSCLFKGGSGTLSNSMKRALLEVVVSGEAGSPAEVRAYAACTLLSASLQQESSSAGTDGIEACINYLKENEFITLRISLQADGTSVEEFVATQLGSAVLASALGPDEGLVVFNELSKARQAFVLENELHIIYQVTPIYMQDVWAGMDWYRYLRIWEALSTDMKRVAELVGVSERFLARAVQGRVVASTGRQGSSLAVHKRFYTALALQDLVNEVPLSHVATKYGATRGMLQALQQSAATFAGMVTVFCGRLGWYNLELLLEQFQSRLTFGVQRELVDLVRLSELNGQRARWLFDAGYQTVAMLAQAQPADIEAVLRKATPFQSSKAGAGESSWELSERQRRRCIWLNGCQGMTEAQAALVLVEKASALLEKDLLAMGIEVSTVRKAADALLPAGETTPVEMNENTEGLPEKPTLQKDSPNIPMEVDVVQASASFKTLVTAGNKIQTTSIPPLPVNAHQHHKPTEAKLDLPAVSGPSTVFTTPVGKPVKAGRHKRRSHPSPVTGSRSPALTTPSSRKQQSPCNASPILTPPAAFLSQVKMKAKTPSPINHQYPSPRPECSRLVGSGHHINTIDSPPTEVAGRLDFNDNTVIATAQVHQANTQLAQRTTVKDAAAICPQTKNQDAVKNAAAICPQTGNQEAVKDAAAICPQTENQDAASQNKPNISPPQSFTQDDFADSFLLDTQTLNLVLDSGSEPRTVSQPVECLTNVGTSETAKVDEVHEARDGVDCVIRTSDFPYRAQHQTSGLDSSTRNLLDVLCSPVTDPRACLDQHAQPSHDRSPYQKRILERDRYHEQVPEIDLCQDQVPGMESILSDEGDLMEASCLHQGFLHASLLESPGLLPASNFEHVGDWEQERCTGAPDALLAPVNQQSNVHTVHTMKADEERYGISPDNTLDDAVMGGLEDSLTLSMLEQALGPMDEALHGNSSVYSAHGVGRSEDHQFVPQHSSNQRKRRSQDAGDSNKKAPRPDDEAGTPEAREGEVAKNESDCVPPTPPKEGEDTFTALRTQNGHLASPVLHRTNGSLNVPSPLLTKKARKNGNNRSKTQENSKRATKTSQHSRSSRSARHRGKENTDSNISEPAEASLSGGVDWNQTVEEESCVVSVPSGPPPLLPVSPLSSTPAASQAFCIIDVAASTALFEHFMQEWNSQKRYGISLACIPRPSGSMQPGTSIGRQFSTRNQVAECELEGMYVDHCPYLVLGLAVSWSQTDAYYIALSKENPNVQLDSSLLPPTLAAELSLEMRLKELRSILNKHRLATQIIFNLKEQYEVLASICDVTLQGQLADPKVAHWLLDPGAKEASLQGLVTTLLPSHTHLLQDIGSSVGVGSIGLNSADAASARVRACVESILVRPLMNALDGCLQEQGMRKALWEVEMPVQRLMAKMTVVGFGFSFEESESQKSIIQAKLSALEEQAYQLAGHPFSLSSSEDIAQVLFIELGLPPSGDPAAPRLPTKTLGPRRAPRGRQKQAFSTAKDVLEKLQPLHPLPGVILEWRRLTGCLTKAVFPLQKERSFNAELNMDRIHGYWISHTATGRLSMADPNIQNVPKDFEIQMPGVIGESPPPVGYPSKSASRRTRGRQPAAHCHVDESAPAYAVSMRHAFVPFQGGVLVAADYSQLELRIIAHLAGDVKLIKVLNGGEDVFKGIAAQMNSVDIEQVTSQQRQQAKQVCYGMLYGIGTKALGEQLGIDENQAAVFVETFKDKYPGLRRFLRDTVKHCAERGFVTTILGRRRYLPAIKENMGHARAQAERQAVNTTVQGSAADVVKVAMVNIDMELEKQARRKLKTGVLGEQRHPVGSRLVLQLHDELIYEVPNKQVHQMAQLMQQHMEQAIPLKVKLPVKVKTGSSWACLADYELPVS